MKKSMRLSNYMSWMKYPDAKYYRKKIGQYVVELLGGTDRGGEIVVWEPKKSAYGVSDDGKYTQLGTANFMYWTSAKDEYDMLKNVKDVMDILWRAM